MNAIGKFTFSKPIRTLKTPQEGAFLYEHVAQGNAVLVRFCECSSYQELELSGFCCIRSEELVARVFSWTSSMPFHSFLIPRSWNI